MTTATAVLSTVPAIARMPRKQAERGVNQLGFLANLSTSSTIQQLAQGVFYADTTCRTTGTVSMALRRSTPWQACQLIAAMLRDGLSFQSEVPAWLNQHALEVLA
jgi:hypothetical protein